MAIVEQIRNIADGKLSSKDIAAIVGATPKYVQSILFQYNLPRLAQGAQLGEDNPSYLHGRKIDLDGYVLVRSPKDHPYSRSRKNRNYGIIYEHRLVAEQKLGRFLLPSEVVDHIDGLHLHNHPDNLRVFPSNSAHLQATITGSTPNWSQAGLEKMKIPSDRRKDHQCVHTYQIDANAVMSACNKSSSRGYDSVKILLSFWEAATGWRKLEFLISLIPAYNSISKRYF